ncbi:hypothetical protein ACO2Q2_16590 [Dyella sp. KRB-257]|uniref:hypothetical protein n=1 Tax=Dyella sp. KRB-257 TaxID=3400915 RepID=UPI003BFBF480
MSTYTRDDLRNAVLQELGVADLQDAPAPEDAKIATARCQQQLEALYDRGLIPFDLDGDAIPARYFIPLTQVIAYRLMMPYGVLNRAQLLAGNATLGMKELTILKNHRYVGQTLHTDYY